MSRLPVTLVTFFAVLGGMDVSVAAEPPAPARVVASRLREGTQLKDQRGAFRAMGDRATFTFEENGPTLMVLENLALERVGRVLRESTDPLTWSVDGLVTEYQGASYLLITRAIVRRHNHFSPSKP
jgi:hypothetical protein